MLFINSIYDPRFTRSHCHCAIYLWYQYRLQIGIMRFMACFPCINIVISYINDTKIFIQKCNRKCWVVCKMEANLFWPQCIRKNSHSPDPVTPLTRLVVSVANGRWHPLSTRQASDDTKGLFQYKGGHSKYKNYHLYKTRLQLYMHHLISMMEIWIL